MLALSLKTFLFVTQDALSIRLDDGVLFRCISLYHWLVTCQVKHLGMPVVLSLMINFILFCVQEVDKVRAFGTIEVSYSWLWYAWLLNICKLMTDARIVNAPANRAQLFSKLLIFHGRFQSVFQCAASLLVEKLILSILLLAEGVAAAGARRGC